jgi:multidrug efflux system outer membrane protein
MPDRFEAVPGDTTLPAAATDTAAYEATRWWTAFDDTTLTTLVDTALAANFELA